VRKASTSGDLRILKTIAEALNAASGVDEALQTTLDRVAKLLGLKTGWIWLADEQTGKFYGAVAQGLPPFLREPVRMAGETCWCLSAFRAGDLEAGNIDVMECSRLRGAVEPASTGGLRYHASVPLYFAGRRLGILNVAAPRWRKLTARELDLLSTVASQVGVAIERARLAGESVRTARADERTRLARQIHDTLAQRLTAIGLHLEAALDRQPADPALRDALVRAIDLSRAGVEDARTAIHQLRSIRRPLLEALDALGHAVSAERGIRVHVRANARPALTPQEEEDLFYIASEALTNVQKHARATDVELTLTSTRRVLRLEVADNGGGFATRKPSTGFGVQGMRERAAALGGQLRIVAAPGRGTRVLFSRARS
jgi:two-component system NarL family sensor kinase